MDIDNLIKDLKNFIEEKKKTPQVGLNPLPVSLGTEEAILNMLMAEINYNYEIKNEQNKEMMSEIYKKIKEITNYINEKIKKNKNKSINYLLSSNPKNYTIVKTNNNGKIFQINKGNYEQNNISNLFYPIYLPGLRIITIVPHIIKNIKHILLNETINNEKLIDNYTGIVIGKSSVDN